MNLDDLIDFARKNPKIVAALVIVILVFVGMNMLPSGGNNSSGQGVYDTSVYGINFHMPGKYIESDRGEFTNGEYADFKDGGALIEISVPTDSNFKESKYIGHKMSKTINGKDGTVYYYKKPSNGDIMKFKYLLEHSGKKVTVRLERGADIDAACGQLRKQNLNK